MLPPDDYADFGGFNAVNAPLCRIDSELAGFAARIGGAVESNRHNAVMRYICVKHDQIKRSLQIMVFVGGEDFTPGPFGVEYGVDGHVWLDHTGVRYAWHKRFNRWPEIPAAEEVLHVLERCWSEVSKVSRNDMARC